MPPRSPVWSVLVALLAACGPDKAETGEPRSEDSEAVVQDSESGGLETGETDTGDSGQDDAAPTVVFLEPLSGAWLRGAVEVSVDASDDLGVESVALYVDGGALTTGTELPFATTLATEALEDGEHTLTAVARDTTAHTAEAEIAVTVDNTAPLVTIDAPADGETVSGTVAFGASASDNYEVTAVTLCLDGDVLGSFGAEPYEVEIDTTLLAHGEITLAARAADEAGNEATDTILLQVDNPPVVTFTSPTETTAGGRVTVTVEATDDDAVTSLSLTEDGVDVATTSSESTLSTTFDTCALEGGSTFLYEAKATDSGGNTTAETLTLTVDQPLEVEITGFEAALEYEVTLSARVFDDERISDVVFDLDGSPVASTSTAGETYTDCFACGCTLYSAPWSTEAAAEGSHTLTVTVTNVSGDTATDSATIVIDYDHDDDGYDSAFYGGDDCDDTDSAESPVAEEACDGEDDDCDGELDEGFDADGDGWLDESACPEVESAWDCDDTDATVSPDAEELCDNGIDDDCDGEDEACAYGGTFDVDTIGYRWQGETNGDCAGISVAGGQDANGDGYDDGLVGANNSGTGGNAYLIYGPVTAGGVLGSTPTVQLSGVARRDYAGISVAFAGDQDGDGIDDLLIGAVGLDGGGTDAGGAYVVLGPVSAELDLSLADATLLGENADDAAGQAVIAAGDVNGDEVPDILVGALRLDSAAANVGSAYLVLGPVSADLDLSLADGSVQGAEASDAIGRYLAGEGDTDGDGYADFAVGSPNASTTDHGYALVFNGPYTGTTTTADADSSLVGITSGDALGVSVGFMDADGDGADDLLASSPERDAVSAREGAVYVRLGPLSGSRSASEADLTLSGLETGADFGVAIAPCEVDDDGYDDLLIGARLGDDGGSNSGNVYLFFGPLSASLTTDSADATFVGADTGDYLGWAVACAGDTDGDGLGDLLLGAYNDDPSPAVYTGAAYLLPFAAVP